MDAFNPRDLLSKLGRPKTYGGLLALGVASVACLALWGRFEHSPRFLHQLAWGVVALGVFGWMSSPSDSRPNLWRGAGICLLQYLLIASFFLVPSLSSDGDFYYGMTRTMLWNRDLNTMEEGARFSNSWMVERAAEGSAFGFPYHPFPIGVSLLWIPFVGLGHLEARLLAAFDPTLPLNGYSEPYLEWLAVGTATMGAAFVLFGYLLLRLRFEHPIASRAILGTLLATPGFFYAFRDSGFPHAASMASIALFLWVWLRAPERMDWKQIFLLAVALSLAALVRWQNCLFALAPILLWFWKAAVRERPAGESLSALVRACGLAGLCLLYCFPQLLLFRLRGPNWLSLQHGGSGDFSLATPKLFSLLFDGRYGLLPWHPFYLLCGIGGLIFLSRGRNRANLLWGGWFLLWIGSAYLNEGGALPFPLTLTLTLLPALFVIARGGDGASRIHRPLGLVFLCAGAEVWINASYLLYHGGGDYGNRLIADLIPFAALGFAYLLLWAREKSLHWVIALAYTLCFVWSLALLWKGTPKITRSPIRLTELISHSSPFASMVQGLGRLDPGLFLSGVWRIAALAICCGVLFAGVLQLIAAWRGGGRGPGRIAIGFTLLPVLVSLWLAIDFRRVDANLYLDNREAGSRTYLAGGELWRQTFNTELSPFIPPGRDYRVSEGRPRFHQNLSSATPTLSWFFPKKWPEGRPIPYVAERLVVLSRVWSDRALDEREPIAKIELATLIPPSTRTFILRANLHTDLPTSLALPPSSPDWHHRGLGAIPRYFASQFLLSPTAELEVLKVSLIPPNVTCELGGVWFSRSPNDRPAPWIENPRKHRTPEYDRRLFGDASFAFVPFPARRHPEASEPARYFSPHDIDRDPPACEFLFFQDPWRLAGETPFELQLGNWKGRQRADWCVLTRDEPDLRIPLPDPALEQAFFALSLGPMPKAWRGGEVGFLRWIREGEILAEKGIRPGREVSFWGEPYLPESQLVWKERRGVHPPVGIFSVDSRAPSSPLSPRELSIELSDAAKEAGVDLAVFGVTLKLRTDLP